MEAQAVTRKLLAAVEALPPGSGRSALVKSAAACAKQAEVSPGVFMASTALLNPTLKGLYKGSPRPQPFRDITMNRHEKSEGLQLTERSVIQPFQGWGFGVTSTQGGASLTLGFGIEPRWGSRAPPPCPDLTGRAGPEVGARH